jgi:hypothetical protein
VFFEKLSGVCTAESLIFLAKCSRESNLCTVCI